jgi:hypothetical protein
MVPPPRGYSGWSSSNDCKKEHVQLNPLDAMPDPAPRFLDDTDRLKAATDQAIAARGGEAHEAVKARIVADAFIGSIRFDRLPAQQLDSYIGRRII